MTEETEFTYKTEASHAYNTTLVNSVSFGISNDSNQRVRISTFFNPNQGKDNLPISYRLNEPSINFARQLIVVSVGDIPVNITFNYRLTDDRGVRLKQPFLGKAEQPKITKDSKVFALTSYDSKINRILLKIIFVKPVNALLVISPTLEGIFEVINFTLTQGVNEGLLVYPVPVFQSSLGNPIIKVKATTDTFFGYNLAQVVYTILDTKKHSCICKKIDNLYLSQISLYIPSFNSVLITDECALSRRAHPEGCTLTDKVQVIANSSYSILVNIVSYGTLRYLLGWLMFKVWDVRILLNRFNTIFYGVLMKSKYQNQYSILKSFNVEEYFRY